MKLQSLQALSGGHHENFTSPFTSIKKEFGARWRISQPPSRGMWWATGTLWASLLAHPHLGTYIR